jgi:signal transduction histidine kinase
MNLKKPILLILLFLLLGSFPLSLHSQNTLSKQVDSLVQKLGQADEHTRTDLLLQISAELQSSQPRQSFEYAREALTLAEETNDTYRYGLACRAIAGIYTVTAVYDKALEYLLMALSRFESLADTVELALCYNDLGVVYMSSDDFANAMKNYRKAVQLNRRAGNYSQIARNYLNMGSNYVKADSIEKGLSYYTVSLLIADSLGMNKEKLDLLNNIGFAYAKLGLNEDALKNFYKVLELTGEQPDDYTRSNAMVNIARGYYSMRNYPAALKYATDGYKLSKEKHFNYIYREASHILSDIYAAQGNYNLAFRYLTEYKNSSDTIMNAEKADQLARIQTLYELNIKDEENARLREENIQNKKRMQNRAFVIAFAVILVAALAILLYQVNKLNDRQLALNKKLTAQSHELEALNDLKDKFFSFVVHNLKNPFNTIMGFAELMQKATSGSDREKIRQYSGLIYDLSSQVQKVLSNLLEWSRLQRRSFECKPEVVELTGLIRDIIEMNNREAARKDIHIRIDEKGSMNVYADRTMIATVLQNLVSNAINFTPTSGKISIECRNDGKQAEVTITDTGVGMSEEHVNRLFRFDFAQAKVGSADSGGAGLGLVICHEILMKNNGTISVKSEQGKGSSFTFTLPVASQSEITMKPEEQVYTDIAGDLLRSDLHLSEEAIADFNISIVPQFHEVSRVLSIDDLELFSKTLIDTGEKYDIVQLIHFGRSLSDLINAHQIDRIIHILPKFGEFIAKYINNYQEVRENTDTDLWNIKT